MFHLYNHNRTTATDIQRSNWFFFFFITILSPINHRVSVGSHLRVTYNGIIYLIGTDPDELIIFRGTCSATGKAGWKSDSNRSPWNETPAAPLGYLSENPRRSICFESSAVYPDGGFVREHSRLSARSPDVRARVFLP